MALLPIICAAFSGVVPGVVENRIDNTTSTSPVIIVRPFLPLPRPRLVSPLEKVDGFPEFEFHFPLCFLAILAMLQRHEFLRRYFVNGR